MSARRDEARPVSARRKLLVLAGAGTLLLTGLVTLAVFFAGPLLAGPSLTRLVVSGRLQHVDPAAVRLALQPFAGTGFFRVDMEAVSGAVRQLPWVARASARRQWPHTLYISIEEETPMARWNTDGLMDAQGRVFAHLKPGEDAPEPYAKLPRLQGPEDEAADVLSEYNTLLALVEPRGLTIVQLKVDERGASTVMLDDGIEVRLGREEADARLSRFAAVALPALGPKLTDVAYVDMRYSNGFAVGWKTAAANNNVAGGQKPNV